MHVPYGYAPDACGGTEIYVRDLARELKPTGICSSIVAPGMYSDVYEIDGCPVHRFAVSKKLSLGELYGEGDEQAANAFGKILDAVKPDLVHLHAFTPAVSIRLVRLVKKNGLPIIFTYHTPTVSCQRGTLLRWGRVDCDGVLGASRCATCAMQGAGLDRLTASMIGALPLGLGRLLESCGVEGGAWTAMRTPDLVHRQHEAVRELFTTVDHIVAPSAWVKDLLLANGTRSKNVSVVRQGCKTDSFSPERNLPSGNRSNETLGIAFLGRIDPTKGVDVVLKALRSLPDLNVGFDVFGIIQSDAAREYVKSLHELASNDPRIRFLPPVDSESVVPTLSGYDLLVVPSRFKETGPLVVLDAFAARIPVVGSNFGGIAERIRDRVDGLLIETDNVRAWAEAIRRLAQDPTLLSRLRAGVRPPRTMRDAATEMREIYKNVLKAHPVASTVAAVGRHEVYTS